MLSIVLRQEGFDSFVVDRGDEAMEAFHAYRPDVVLLDLMLPVLDGWSVLAELGLHRDAPPVVVCSARTAPRDRRRAYDMGADVFLAKPFEVPELLDALRSVLTRPSTESRDLSLDGLLGGAPGVSPA
jgi:DNA-binding response OmpR family regulator